MSTKASANVRMYRLNELGDCFLISFKADGKTSRMLIDCGSFRNGGPSIARLKQITDSIKKDLAGKPLDVIVGTHQHNDHLSGFVHCKDTFKKIGAGQVWLSWLDDPKDRKARELGSKYNNLVKALFKARQHFMAVPGARGSTRPLEVLNDVLGFHGAKDAKTPPELPADAVKFLKTLGKKDPEYLRPGRVLNMPGLPAGSVRIYVLGPPRDTTLINKIKPGEGESYDHALHFNSLAASKFLDAIEHHDHADSSSGDEKQYPFNKVYKLHGAGLNGPAIKAMRSHYNKRDADWRRIDSDWMNQAESLALFLDKFTNNSSLALAIELVESGKVLLFAADAQTGNWRSWSDVKWDKDGVTLDDLLTRTVLYKVGHHASHNATLVETFEKMTHPNLVALIPVHKRDPNITKDGGWKMPATNLFKRLAAKTENRVLQMDDVNPKNCQPDKEPAKAAWRRAGIKPKVTDMYIELEFSE